VQNAAVGEVRRVVRSFAVRVRERGLVAAGRVLRLTGAAVAAYLVAYVTVTDNRPVTAALTALLIVQVTLVGTITDTIRRIVSVVAGVGLAIGVSAFVGFTWWSLGAIVAASLVVGQLLRLGPHLLEVPISAMLILAVGGLEAKAIDRVAETLVGALVGLLVNVVFPPAVKTRSAGAAVERFAERVAGLLDRVARSLSGGSTTRGEVRGWLEEARSITGDLSRVEQQLDEARQSRRLNPRAVGTADTTPDLRSGLDALEHSAVALRAVFRSIADRAGAVPDATDLEDMPQEFHDEELRRAYATLMGNLARAVRAFGALVRAEVDQAETPHAEELAEALEAVGEARAGLTELLLVDAAESPGLWQLHGSLLAGVERVLAELDVQQRMRRRRQRREQAEALRRPSAQAAERLRSTARRVVREGREGAAKHVPRR
jgi:hypothetical protein